MANRLLKDKLRNDRLVDIDRRNRSARKCDDKAFAKWGPGQIKAGKAEDIRRSRLTRRQRIREDVFAGLRPPIPIHGSLKRGIPRGLRRSPSFQAELAAKRKASV
jgi:hypothetical protein